MIEHAFTPKAGSIGIGLCAQCNKPPTHSNHAGFEPEPPEETEQIVDAEFETEDGTDSNTGVTQAEDDALSKRIRDNRKSMGAGIGAAGFGQVGGEIIHHLLGNPEHDRVGIIDQAIELAGHMSESSELREELLNYSAAFIIGRLGPPQMGVPQMGVQQEVEK